MSTKLSVSGMGCDGCEEIIEGALEDVEGVESANVDHEAGTAVIEGDADEDELVRVVDFAGYEAELAE